MTFDDYLKTITWDDLKQSGSDHYKSNGAEQVDLYKSIGLGTLAVWALTGAQRRASRNLQAIERGDEININDIKKIIHELMFLYVELREKEVK